MLRGIVETICISNNRYLQRRYQDEVLSKDGREFTLYHVDTAFDKIRYSDWVSPSNYPDLTVRLCFLPKSEPIDEHEELKIRTIKAFVLNKRSYEDFDLEDLHITLRFKVSFETAVNGGYELDITTPEERQPVTI